MANRIKLSDRFLAGALDAGSFIAEFIPFAGAAVGHRNDPPQLAARWRHARLASGDVESWEIFKGEPQSGKLPKDYQRVAMVGIQKRVLDELQEEYGGQQAVIYALGSATMIGTVEDQTRFLGDFPHAPDRYAVGMRLGQGVLRAAIALRSGNGSAIVPFDGMARGGVYSRADWPDSVPIV